MTEIPTYEEILQEVADSLQNLVYRIQDQVKEIQREKGEGDYD